jgi:hypothetical protein
MEPSLPQHIAKGAVGHRFSSGSNGVAKKIDAEKAKQGHWGMHVLVILICGLILAGVVWFGLEIYGEHLANEPAALHINNG